MRLDGVAKGVGALLAGLAMLGPMAADAAPGVVTQNINLRAGPGIDYPLVAQLPAGTPAEIFGCLQGWGWCDVAIQDARGWAAGAGLQLLYDDRPEPLVNYGAVIGIPLVGFDVDSYWGRHYRGRPWYHDVGRWRGEGQHGGPPGGLPGRFRGQPGVAHPVGPAAFQDHAPGPGREPEPGRPPEPGRGPQMGRAPEVITPHAATRTAEPGPRPGPPPGPRPEPGPRPGPAPAPAQVQPGPRPEPRPQGPAPVGHPDPGRPAGPHGGREPPHP